MGTDQRAATGRSRGSTPAGDRHHGGRAHAVRTRRVGRLEANAHRKALRQADPVESALDRRQTIDTGPVRRVHGPADALDDTAKASVRVAQEIDVGLKARLDDVQISLAKVRHDVPAAIIDQREHLLTRAGVLADGDVQVGHVTFERRPDGAIADVELRAAQRGLRGFQPRVQVADLRQQLLGPLALLGRRLAARSRRAQMRASLLDLVDRDEAAPDQRLDATQIVGGVRLFGGARRERARRGADRVVLRGEIGLGERQSGSARVEACRVGALVDDEQQVALRARVGCRRHAGRR